MTARTTAESRFYSVPVFGWIARDIAREPESIWYALVILLTVLILSIMTWGIMVLSLLAVAIVPVMFALLIKISMG